MLFFAVDEAIVRNLGQRDFENFKVFCCQIINITVILKAVNALQDLGTWVVHKTNQ